jgi:lipoyl(octanoyl) transferase
MYTYPNKQVHSQRLGLIDYQTAWTLQERLFADIVDQKVANRALPPDQKRPTPNHLLFCEHPPVYTIGTSGKAENLLLTEDDLRQQHGASVFRIRRGGDITFHGPGQLVGYPIFDLDNFFTDIHLYMRLLEESIIRTLADYGLSAGRIDGLTGVWLDAEPGDPSRMAGPARKICALGVKASRWVTMHGFALNINTDLQFFDYIVPCGIADKAVTSMQQELGRPIDVAEVTNRVQQHLAELFDFELVA